MSPHEFLGTLDAAIANAPRGRRAIALELAVPGGVLWGEQGKPCGQDQQGRLCYGFTAAQCRRLRDVVLDAAGQDSGVRRG